MSILGWRQLLHGMGIPLSLRDTVRMFLVGNLGRYLPAGKAWQMGIVSSMAAERGLPPAQIAATSLLQGIVGAAMGAVLLLLLGARLLQRSMVWFLVPAILIAMILALPAIIRSSARLKTMLAERMPGFESASVLTMGLLVLASLVSWMLWGVALYAIGRGLLGDGAESVLNYVVAWIGSLLAGVVAVVAPAGLGVRDATMQMLLTRAGVASSGALVVVVVARVWSTMMEVVPAAVMLIAGRANRRGQRRVT